MENIKEPILEICVDSVASAIAAQEGGADRIEFCGHLMIGGTTPSPAFYEETIKVVKVPMNVMIRPRFGDFCYTEDEVNIMEKEIHLFRKLGANGVVFGVLNPDGRLNKPIMERLRKAAGDMECTLHRAIDVSLDPLSTMEDAISIGMNTILTSGQKESCLEGVSLLKELHEKASGRIDIMAGAGLVPEKIPELYAETGITAYHMSGAVPFDSKMKYRNKEVHMGIPGRSEYDGSVCSAEKVSLAKQYLNSISNT